MLINILFQTYLLQISSCLNLVNTAAGKVEPQVYGSADGVVLLVKGQYYVYMASIQYVERNVIFVYLCEQKAMLKFKSLAKADCYSK